MKHLLQRVSDGKYVTKPGEKHSYTKHWQDARFFDSLEQAQSEQCTENEIAVPLSYVLNQF